MLVEGLKLYGTREVVGDGDNPEILLWAAEVGLVGLYKHDSTAWCGLYMALVAKRAGKPVPYQPLWALNWAKFGGPASEAMLGDTLVFRRPGGGGHVGLYVGEDPAAFHCLGGNTGDAVAIARISKDRLAAVRRPLYLNPPQNIRPIHLTADGALSVNEA